MEVELPECCSHCRLHNLMTLSCLYRRTFLACCNTVLSTCSE